MTVPLGNARPCLGTLLLVPSWGVLWGQGCSCSTPALLGWPLQTGGGQELRGRGQEVEGQKERPSQSQGARETQGTGATDTFLSPLSVAPLAA